MKPRTIIIIVVCGCGALFVVGVVSCAGILAFSFRTMDTAISPAIDELFAAAVNDTFVEKYETHTAAEFRQAITRKQWEDMGLTIKTRLGRLKSKNLRQFNVRQMNANRFAEVTYSANFEHGPGTISARLRKDGEQWRIVNFHVNSPEFQKDFASSKCPHCGEPHTLTANFCPKCGRSLTDRESVPPASPGSVSEKGA